MRYWSFQIAGPIDVREETVAVQLFCSMMQTEKHCNTALHMSSDKGVYDFVLQSEYMQ